MTPTGPAAEGDPVLAGAAAHADGNIVGILFDPTPPHLVGKEMEGLVDWTTEELRMKEIHPLIIIGNFILEFLAIHPFQDGNGRVGRLLLNNILLKHKLPPVNIGFENRAEYYNALQEYQNNGNIRPMAELVIKEYKRLKK